MKIALSLIVKGTKDIMQINIKLEKDGDFIKYQVENEGLVLNGKVQMTFGDLSYSELSRGITKSLEVVTDKQILDNHKKLK